ncbi:MAG: ABC transporter ATP-binding protein [bacterium]
MEKKTPIITIKNLHYTYPDGTVALRGVDLTVFAGETIALVGKNGSGKSTLIKHINGIYRPEEGEIMVDGLAVTRENLKEIRARVGMVFQDPDSQLFCSTLYDDVAFGPINMDMEDGLVRQRVREALDKMGLLELMDRPPHDLSFGQRKRAAMATVLSMRPKIMIFDEPTSNLDPKNEAIMTDILRSLPATMILISHDLPILYQTCQKVVIMKGGKVDQIISMKDFISDVDLLRNNGLDFTFRCDCCQDRDHHHYLTGEYPMEKTSEPSTSCV